MIREQRLRTEKKLRELLEQEQLAVKEDESESDNSDSEYPEPEVLDTGNRSTTAVPNQVCLISVICLVVICLVFFLSWFESNFVCYRISLLILNT